MFSYQKNFSNPTLPVDEARFFALVRATQWKENIDKFRETGDASLKRKLPAFIFQATFDETTSKAGKSGAWRKQSATRLTGLVVMDVDHVENPREVFEGWGETELRNHGVLLVYVTPSGKGLKIVFKARTEWGNLIDNQHQMAKLLGVEVDESCKDASRMSFICKEEDILFLDKELFTYENREYGEKFDEEYRRGYSAASRTRLDENQNENENKGEASEVDERIRFIAKGVMKEKGLLESDFIDEGGRHTTVKMFLSGVTQLLKKDEANGVLKELMPEHWNDENIQKLVEDFYQNYTNPNQRLLRYQESLFTQSRRLGKEKTEELSSNSSLFTLNSSLTDWGKEIESLMPQYPILRDVCRGLKYNQYPAAMFVAGGLLMTLMTRCTYRFYHRPEELRRLNNSTLIIGDPASGKSFATRLFKLLSLPIKEVDEEGIKAINAYREQMKTKGANKEKPKKPKVIVRVHPARTSNAQFIQDMVNSVEEVDGKPMQLHMLTFDTELDNTLTLQKGGAYIDKQSLQLKAFHNEEDGQAYSNNDSVFQNFYVIWNFIYTGTPIALKKMVNDQNFGSGLATRLTCIPLPATNFEMMSREETVDYDSDARLTEWARKLDRMKGELTIQKIVDELYDWTARRMMDAKDNDSRADEMLLKRCAYHGINFSAPFIVMRHWEQMKQDGNYWCGEFETDETDWRLAELITNIQFACQKYYFGAMAENYFDNKLRDANVNVQRRQKTIEAFNRLPEEFTNEDVMRCFGLTSSSSARNRTCSLIRDHLAEKVREERGTLQALYRKTGATII